MQFVNFVRESKHGITTQIKDRCAKIGNPFFLYGRRVRLTSIPGAKAPRGAMWSYTSRNCEQIAKRFKKKKRRPDAKKVIRTHITAIKVKEVNLQVSKGRETVLKKDIFLSWLLKKGT